MAKEASLESFRVTVRKLEQAVAQLAQLPARVAGFERKLMQLEQRVGQLLGRAGIAVIEPEPAPAAEPAIPPPVGATAQEVGAVVREAITELGTQLAAVLRDIASPLTVAPLPPGVRPVGVKNGSKLPSDDLGDLGVDPKSVVAFEQAKG